MALKTVVKVGGITNLSDARYCAGMGVDMLGFCVTENHSGYMSPELFQQIRGWVTGPKIVAEVYATPTQEELQRIMENYAPDYVEMSFDDALAFQGKLPTPKIIPLTPPDFARIAKLPPETDYVIANEEDIANVPGGPFSILVRTQATETVSRLLGDKRIDGFVLNGSSEIRPGFKDYDHLAEILEILEED